MTGTDFAAIPDEVMLLILLRSFEPPHCAGWRHRRVEDLLERSGVISVQVLSEFTAVATRKLGLSFAEVSEILREDTQLTRRS